MQNKKKYIIAIDQGGTKTDIIIADHEGKIAGYGNDRDFLASEDIKKYPVYFKKDRRVIRNIRIAHTAEKALSAAALKISDIDSISASCTGADWKYEYELGIRNLRNTLGIANISLYNDCIGALRGGTDIFNRDSAVLCLGTGANCALKNREGEELIYAYYLKDIHQGASAIGRYVFNAVFDSEAGLKGKTLLTKLLLEETGHSSVDELYMHISAGRNENEDQWEPVYKEYCHLLFKAAIAKDELSCKYLDWFCRGLASYIKLGAIKLGMQDREINLVLSGGVFKNASLMADLIYVNLKQDLNGIKCIHAHFEPVVGALLLEYDKIYTGKIPDKVILVLEKSCMEYNLIRLINPPDLSA